MSRREQEKPKTHGVKHTGLGCKVERDVEEKRNECRCRAQSDKLLNDAVLEEVLASHVSLSAEDKNRVLRGVVGELWSAIIKSVMQERRMVAAARKTLDR